METEPEFTLPSGWLISGLQRAKLEADDNPEIRERVRRNPSGLILSDNEDGQ